jgi:hypothetical protein
MLAVSRNGGPLQNIHLSNGNGSVPFYVELFFLCTLCCQFLRTFFDCHSSCVPYIATEGTQDEGQSKKVRWYWQYRVHKTNGNQKRSGETGNIGYTRRRAIKQDRRNWQQRGLCCQFLRTFFDCHSSCVPYIASITGPFLIAIRLVYPLLPVSPDL